MPINRMPTLQFINVKQRNRLDSLVTDVTPNSPPEVIAKVRELIKQEFDKSPEEFDPSDVEKFMNSDWQITRFLLRKKDNIEDAAKMIVGCAKWRHRLGMPRWKDEDFPKEFYNVGGVFPYAPDELGNTVIYVRAKLYDKKLSCIQEVFRHYLIHIANRVDEERDGRGWSIIFDCSGTGMSNMDVNMLLFMLNDVVPHLPKGLNYVLIYELPWLLSKIVNGAVSVLPNDYRKLVKTASKKDINNWVAQESLPDFMGGTCDINYRRSPKGCRSFEEMADELKWTEKDLAAIKKVYQPHLDEATEAIQARKRKNMRRTSSVLEFWHWMKLKTTGVAAGGDSNASNVKDQDNSSSTNKNEQPINKKISVSSRGSGKKLESIKDEAGD